METTFANIRTSYDDNPALFNALEKAIEAYGDARRRINEEGEYANWEDSEQMDEALTDYSYQVAAAYEDEVREYGYLNEDLSTNETLLAHRVEALKHVDDIRYYSKEKLEGEVPVEHKEEIGW
jgi:hypothetical protein